MADLTPEKLEEIKKREAAAMPGPWRWTQEEGHGANNFLRCDGCHVPIAEHMSGFPNCEFIAHARTDIPDLLSALAAATNERDDAVKRAERAEALLGQIRKTVTNDEIDDVKMMEWIAEVLEDQP